MSANRVVMFSGGVGSWAAARRVRDRFPEDRMVALFADTGMEDEDLYRFLPQAAKSVDAELVVVADGRTPWEVFSDVRFLGNTRVDPCSRILKREILDKWLCDNCDPATTVVYLGIDWQEAHRFERARLRMSGFVVEAPLCEEPFRFKDDWIADLRECGIIPPRLYGMGFSHNNCGGFCVKGGHAHFANLLRQMPERYAYHEEQEERLRVHLGDVAVLRDRAGGVTRPLTMRAFRERIEDGGTYDLLDYGACSCLSVEEAKP